MEDINSSAYYKAELSFLTSIPQKSNKEIIVGKWVIFKSCEMELIGKYTFCALEKSSEALKD